MSTSSPPRCPSGHLSSCLLHRDCRVRQARRRLPWPCCHWAEKGIGQSAGVRRRSPSAISSSSPCGPVTCPSPIRTLAALAVFLEIRPAAVAAAAAAASVQTATASEHTVPYANTAATGATRASVVTEDDHEEHLLMGSDTMRPPVFPQYSIASPWTPQEEGLFDPPSAHPDAVPPMRAGSSSSSRPRTGRGVGESVDHDTTDVHGGAA